MCERLDRNLMCDIRPPPLVVNDDDDDNFQDEHSEIVHARKSGPSYNYLVNHMMITFNMHQMYDMSKFDIKFGDFRADDDLSQLLELFILVLQLTVSQMGSSDDHSLYVTMWKFDKNKEYMTWSLNPKLNVSDASGAHSFPFFKKLHETFYKINKFQKMYKNIDKTVDWIVSLYKSFCSNDFLAERFKEPFSHENSETCTPDEYMLIDFLNWTSTVELFKKDRVIRSEEDVTKKGNIVAQYKFNLKCVFQKSFFTYSIPSNTGQAYDDDMMDVMKDIMRDNPSTTTVLNTYSKFSFSLHCKRYVREDDCMRGIEVLSTDSPQEKFDKREKLKNRAQLLTMRFSQRMKIFSKINGEEFFKHTENPLKNFQWTRLSKNHQVLRDPLLMFQFVIGKINKEIEDLESEIVHAILMNDREYNVNAVIEKTTYFDLRRRYNSKKAKVLDTLTMAYKKAHLLYHASHEENVEVSEETMKFVKSELDNEKAFFKSLEDEVLDEDDCAEGPHNEFYTSYMELLELEAMHMRIYRIAGNMKRLKDLKKLKEEKFDQFLVSKSVREIMPFSVKGLIETFNDGLFSKDYTSMTVDEANKIISLWEIHHITESDLGSLCIESDFQTIRRELGLKGTDFNYKLFDHACCTLFDFYVDPVNLMTVGYKGTGKSHVNKEVISHSVAGLISWKTEDQSSKSAYADWNLDNLCINFMDEASERYFQQTVGGDSHQLKNMLSNDYISHKYLEMNSQTVRKGSKKRKTVMREQKHMHHFNRKGLCTSANVAPDPNSPLANRMEVVQHFIEEEGIINKILQFKSLFNGQGSLQTTKLKYKNTFKLRQSVVLMYLLYQSLGVLGGKRPYTSNISESLVYPMLMNFKEYYKSYCVEPRTIKRAHSFISSSMHQRAFNLNFVVPKAKYRFRKDKGFIYDHLMFPDQPTGEPNEDARKPTIHEVCQSMHDLAFTTTNDLVSAMSLIGPEIMNPLEREVIKAIFERLKLKKRGVEGYWFVNKYENLRSNASKVLTYANEVVAKDPTLSFFKSTQLVQGRGSSSSSSGSGGASFTAMNFGMSMGSIDSNGFSSGNSNSGSNSRGNDNNNRVEYNPNYLRLYTGTNREGFYKTIIANLPFPAVDSQIKSIFKKWAMMGLVGTGTLVNMVNSNGKYDFVDDHDTSSNWDEFSGQPGIFLSEKWMNGKYVLEFSIHGLKTFAGLIMNNNEEIFEKVVKKSVRSLNCYNSNFYFYNNRINKCFSNSIELQKLVKSYGNGADPNVLEMKEDYEIESVLDELDKVKLFVNKKPLSTCTEIKNQRRVGIDNKIVIIDSLRESHVSTDLANQANTNSIVRLKHDFDEMSKEMHLSKFSKERANGINEYLKGLNMY